MSEFGQRLQTAENQAQLRGVNYSSAQMRDQQRIQHDSCKGPGDHFYSNEGDLRGFYKYLKYSKHGIVGLGSDQVLDLLAASGTSRALLLDYSPINILAVRAQLEVGTRHVKTFEEYPTPEQFREYFASENNDQLKRILYSVYAPKQVAAVMKIFEPGIPFFGRSIPFSNFMKIRSDISEEDGSSAAWYGTTEKLTKVIEAYTQGNVLLSLSDLTRRDHIRDVANFTRARGFKFDVVYWSNFEEYQPESVWDGLDLLPVTPDAKILKTSLDVAQPYSDQIKLNPVLSRLVMPTMYVLVQHQDRRDFPWMKPGSSLYPDPRSNNFYFLSTAR